VDQIPVSSGDVVFSVYQEDEFSVETWESRGENINEDGSVIPKLTPENMKLEKNETNDQPAEEKTE